MASLKEVRTRINSVNSTQQITKAMKMVAAAKLRRAQDRIVQMRPYSEKLESILENVTATLGSDDVSNPFAEDRSTKNKVLIVAVTSDRGLCGGFNANIIKEVKAVIDTKYATQYKNGNVEIMCVGSKGYDFFKRRDYKLNDKYVDLFTKLSFDLAKEAAEYAMNGFLNGDFDVVEVVYNEFKNVATQIIRTEQLLPLSQTSDDDAEENVELDYIFEPNKEEIVEDLIPKTLKISFYKALLESNASEHGARMTAMDKATENAGELLKELKLTYNRTRQAAITKEILEIVGGAEALEN